MWEIVTLGMYRLFSLGFKEEKIDEVLILNQALSRLGMLTIFTNNLKYKQEILMLLIDMYLTLQLQVQYTFFSRHV